MRKFKTIADLHTAVQSGKVDAPGMLFVPVKSGPDPMISMILEHIKESSASTQEALLTSVQAISTYFADRPVTVNMPPDHGAREWKFTVVRGADDFVREIVATRTK